MAILTTATGDPLVDENSQVLTDDVVIGNRVLDYGLLVLSNEANRVLLCPAEPADCTSATTPSNTALGWAGIDCRRSPPLPVGSRGGEPSW